MGPGADEAKTRLYCEESVEHYNWLVECGVDFKPEFYGEPGFGPAGDQGLMYSGGENAWPFTEIARPAPRGHLPQLTGPRTGDKGRGYMLMAPLVAKAESLGVRTEYDVRIERLVVERDGRVVGVIGTRYGEEIAIRARRGVVLATGSFVYNDDMVARSAPLMLGRAAAAIEQHDGQAIRMGQAIGADVSRYDHVSMCWIW